LRLPPPHSTQAPVAGKKCPRACGVLAVPNIPDGSIQTVFVVQISSACALGPPTPAASTSAVALNFESFQSPSAPGLELLGDLIWMNRSRDYDMHVIRSTVDGMEFPAANPTMFYDR